MDPNTETTILGGGCFWCLEAVYDQLEGVLDVVSGYAGGFTPNPDYKTVCAGTTGHAEVVKVTFNPAQITFEEILEVFFSIHDPTTLNRQGADVGSQYRSVVFYQDNQQKAAAEKVIAEINQARIWASPIVTEVTQFKKFFPAEEEHQEYFQRNPSQGYCKVVIAPKVLKFRRKYANRLKG